MKREFDDLRKSVRAVLRRSAENVFYLNFPKPAPYPYIVFDLRQVSNGESGKIDYQLDIDVVGRETVQVDSISDKVQESLDHLIVTTNRFLYHSYIVTAQHIVEDDKSLSRMHIRADLYFFIKGV